MKLHNTQCKLFPKGKSELFFLLMLFSPLLGVSGFWYLMFISYFLYYFLALKTKNSIWGVVFSLFFLLFLYIKYKQIPNLTIWFTTVKFYMGWAVVTLFLYYTRISVNIHKLIILLCSEILLEFVLINTIIPTSVLLNYPQFDHTIMTGSFVRVYSIGCNATNTSTILVLLLAYRESIIKRGVKVNSKIVNRLISIISLIAVSVLGSGTGFCLYILFILYKYNLFTIKYLFFLIVAMIGIILVLFYVTFDEKSIFQRFSIDYVYFLWDFKEWQISELIKQYKITNPFMGSAFKNEDVALIWGDFAFLQYYISLGICGISLFILYLLKFVNKLNFFPILIGVIGAFHYGGIFTFPGQLVLSYCVLLNSETFLYYTEPIRVRCKNRK